MTTESNEIEPFVLDLKKSYFSRLPFSIPEKTVLETYRTFDLLCDFIHEDPSAVLEVDEWIKKFVSQRKNPVVNNKVFIQEIPSSLFGLSNGSGKKSSQFDVMSYHYVSGLYEFLYDHTKGLPSVCLQFLELMRGLYEEIKKNLEPVLKFVRKKVPSRNILKIWRHKPTKEQDCFHPLHNDRTIFTALIHNTKPKCLKLYTPEKDKAYYPVPADFPFLISGGFAKPHFNINPIPHAVEKTQDPSSRHSLVFFITDPNLWVATGNLKPRK